MMLQAQVLCEGAAEGEVLRFDAPISFWGGVDPASARVILADHPQQGMSLEGKVVIIPELIGSSSSSAVMLELIYQKHHPAALILGQRDAILPIGVLVAQQMVWGSIPVFLLPDAPFVTGDRLRLEPDGRIIRQAALA